MNVCVQEGPSANVAAHSYQSNPKLLLAGVTIIWLKRKENMRA